MGVAITRPAPRRPLLRPRYGRLLLRVSTVAIVAISAWSFLLAPLVGHFTGRFEDFSAYIGAARDMAAGRSPYFAFNGDASVVMTGFDYPPFAAVLVRPLALFTDNGAMTLWLWLSVACTVTGAIVVARTALPASWPRTEIAVVAALAFAPATYNFWHGQMNPVVFLLMALAFQSWVRGRELRCGLLLGIATGIKLAPLVLVVLLIRRGWWRGALAMGATVVASVAAAVPLIGTSAVQYFGSTVLPALIRDTGWIYNQSLGAAVSRMANHSVLLIGSDSRAVRYALLLVSAVVLGFAAWRVQPGVRDGVERGAEFGLGVTAMLLAASIAWYPHFTYLLIPLAAAAGLLAQRGWRADVAVLRSAIACLVVFGLVVPLVVAAIDMHTLTSIAATRWWWPYLQLYSLPGVTALALFVALHRALGRKQPAPARTG